MQGMASLPKVDNYRFYAGHSIISNNGQYIADKDWQEIGVLAKEKDGLEFKLRFSESSKLGFFTSISFSEDGQYLAAGSNQGNIKVWKWKAGDLILDRELPGRISSLGFSQNGQYLIAGTEEGQIATWTLKVEEPKMNDMLSGRIWRTGIDPHFP